MNQEEENQPESTDRLHVWVAQNRENLQKLKNAFGVQEEVFNNYIYQLENINSKYLKEWVQVRNEYLLNHYEKASGYTKVIIGLGYLGFFNVWHSVIDKLDRTVVIISGLSVALAVGVFVFFEVRAMFLEGTKSQIKVNTPMDHEFDVFQDISEIDRKWEEIGERMNEFWKFQFLFSAFFGFFGLIVLMIGFLGPLLIEVIGWPWPEYIDWCIQNGKEFLKNIFSLC